MSGESHVAAISQNFFVFGWTIMTFSAGTREEKERTFYLSPSGRGGLRSNPGEGPQRPR
jgi:hypothetical protein